VPEGQDGNNIMRCYGHGKPISISTKVHMQLWLFYKKKLIGARPDCLPRELCAGVDDLSRRPKAQSGAMAFARPAWTQRPVTAPWVHRFFVQICRQNEKRKLLQLCLNPLILSSCDLARWRTRLTGCFVCLRKILTPNFVFPGCSRIPLHLRI
jgi:hypothetical protein